MIFFLIFSQLFTSISSIFTKQHQFTLNFCRMLCLKCSPFKVMANQVRALLSPEIFQFIELLKLCELLGKYNKTIFGMSKQLLKLVGKRPKTWFWLNHNSPKINKKIQKTTAKLQKKLRKQHQTYLTWKLNCLVLDVSGIILEIIEKMINKNKEVTF